MVGSVVVRSQRSTPTTQRRALALTTAARIAATRAVAPTPAPEHPVQIVEAPPEADALTILTARGGKLLTKRHTPTETIGYSRALRFDARTIEIRSIEDLHQVLEDLAGEPRSCVVRGALTDGRREAANVNRRYLEDAKRPEPPDVEAADHRWIMSDVDGIEAPPWFDIADPESRRRALEWLRDTQLPPELHGVACSAWWSGSMGVKGGLRAHLWLLLDRPVCDHSLKAWLQRWPVDCALFVATQPHYHAAPIFDGVADPLDGDRGVLLEGAPVAIAPPELVDLATWQTREAKATAKREAARLERQRRLEAGELQPVAGEAAEAYARRALENACSAIATAAKGDRHRVIRDRAYAIGSFVNAGVLARGLAYDELERAAMALEDADARHVRTTIGSGLDRAPAFDLERLARPTRRPEALPEPPAADVPHTVDSLPAEQEIAPHWPAPAANRTAELARQTATITGWVETEVVRVQVARETETIRQRLLEAEGLEKIIGLDTAADLDELHADIVARRASRLTEVEAELEEITTRKGKRAAARIAKLEAEVRRLRSTIDVKKGARLRKTALSRQARREELDNRGIDRLSVRGDRPVITGAQGTGKTTDVQAAVAAINDPKIAVHMYAPSTAKAHEAKAEYDAKKRPESLPAIVALGRGAKDPRSADGERMCPRHETARIDRAGAAGVNIMKSICLSCTQSGSCGYMRQRRELEEQCERGGALYILSHAYLTIPTPVTLAAPDLVVVDESPLSTMAGLVGFTPERITHQRIPQHLSGAGETLLLVHDSIVGHADTAQHAMRDKGITLKKLKHAKRALDATAKEDLAEVNGAMSDETIRQRIEEHEKNESGLVSLLLRQIIREWSTGRDGLNSVTYEPDAPKTIEGERRRVAWVYVSYLKNFRPGSKRPVLTLDGTGDPELLRLILGQRLTETRIAVERNAEVIQVRGKVFSSQSIDGCRPNGEPLGDAPAKRAERLRREILEVVPRVPGERKVVFSTRRGESALADELERLGIVHDHYGNIRGKNKYGPDELDCDTGILISRIQPSAREIERLAGAYTATDPEPLQRTGAYVQTTRGRRMAGGRGEGEQVWIHADERCQRVLEQLREKEMEQTADRLRLIFGEKIKRLFVFTSLPLDLTITRSLRWSELVAGGNQIERGLAALKAGVGAVTAEILAESLGTSVRFARGLFGPYGTDRQIDLLAKGSVRSWGAVEYAQRGPPCKCLVRANLEPYAAIEALVGPVRWVRLLGASEPLPRPPIAQTALELQNTAGESGLSEFREPPEAEKAEPEIAAAPAEPLDRADVDRLARQVRADVRAMGGAPQAALDAFKSALREAATIDEVIAACRILREATAQSAEEQPP